MEEDSNVGQTKRRAHGEMRRLVLASLQSAGESGISVKELSKSLSIEPAHLHAWFFFNAKKGHFEKIGRGRYRITPSDSPR